MVNLKQLANRAKVKFKTRGLAKGRDINASPPERTIYKAPFVPSSPSGDVREFGNDSANRRMKIPIVPYHNLGPLGKRKPESNYPDKNFIKRNAKKLRGKVI